LILKNLWDDTAAGEYSTDLSLRVYTSNLLGQSDELVLHGGGNTSVKSVINNEEILYVKGSGWDLVSIKEEGFAPVKMSILLEMAACKVLSDVDMVARQKAAMLDKNAPNPSVEAILHALIPFKVVDHTHADAVVTLSNSVNGEALIAEVFSDFLIVPYVMPGFILARKIYEMTRGDFDWQKCKGIILHNHGIFTFDDDAKRSYDKMIEAVSRAESYLQQHAPLEILSIKNGREIDLVQLQYVISQKKGFDTVCKTDCSDLARFYASQRDLETFATRGVLTPEHIIRTKRVPMVWMEGDDPEKAVERYINDYTNYFQTFAKDEICLNPAPNYAVIQNFGLVYFGKNEKEVSVMADIVQHTMKAVLSADKLGGYRSISLEESFRMEYWELEQIKLISHR